MTEDELVRIRAFSRRVHRAASSRIESFRWGTAYFNDDNPLVWDLNFLHLEGSSIGVDAEGLVAEAERVMGAAFSHRQIWLDDDDLAGRLAPGFRDAGWKVDRHVVMAHRRPPERIPDTSRVQEIPEDLAWASREEWLRTSEQTKSDAVLAQMHAQYRLLNEICAGVDYGIVEDGKAVSFALLHIHGGVGEVADVATLEPYRNRGLARAVVWRAVQEARERGCRDVFLVADDLDWPKELYAKLGFDAIAYRHYFLLTDRPT